MMWSQRVTKWAEDRNLIQGSDPKSQFVKLIEEIGELSRGVQKKDLKLIEDSIGDAAVVLCILAAQNGLTFDQCQEAAWQEIKDRTGRMENGVFLKD